MATNEQAVQATIGRMTTALANADVDGIMSTYERDVVILFEPAAPVSEPATLREKFEELIAIEPRFAYGEHEIVAIGDIALHLMPWGMTGKAPDGSVIEQSGLSAAVLRRQPDGQWLMVIDNPHAQHTMNGK